jgi:hypothetical protein
MRPFLDDYQRAPPFGELPVVLHRREDSLVPLL